MLISPDAELKGGGGVWFFAYTMIWSCWEFRMDFLDGFDVLKLYLHRLPAKAATVNGLHF